MISDAQRYDAAAKAALSAALWSSTDADVMLKIIRPRDFHPRDDTIAAAILDLRQRGVIWNEPQPVIDTLHNYRQLWIDRLADRRAGRDNPTPLEDLVDADRWPLRFARDALVTGRVYDIQAHIADVDVETSAREIAAVRRHEVTEATMQTVSRILTNPPAGSTRADRQRAVTETMHRYRRDMGATHLYPPPAALPRPRPSLER